MWNWNPTYAAILSDHFKMSTIVLESETLQNAEIER